MTTYQLIVTGLVFRGIVCIPEGACLLENRVSLGEDKVRWLLKEKLISLAQALFLRPELGEKGGRYEVEVKKLAQSFPNAIRNFCLTVNEITTGMPKKVLERQHYLGGGGLEPDVPKLHVNVGDTFDHVGDMRGCIGPCMVKYILPDGRVQLQESSNWEDHGFSGPPISD